MPIAPGTKLGPYEIVDALGAGGMGEVYRARDTRLGRDVAVKVLPPSFAADTDRVRRFEQEAQAAGQVNHPNILAIYDVGTHDGSPYVVSELLEGESLREVLSGGPLPVRKTIDYASQVAQGLAAAHARGIVHRDLKPENLFVTPDGRVKILDFGLAKLTERQPGTTASASPTVLADTQPGMVLGTVGYMSPEQVRGLPADHRADIFGLGAVLYEMVAGRRAFGGESAVETMNAILTQEPPQASGSHSDLPPVLDGIIRRCLEKRPERRFQSASDLAFALTSISTLSTSGLGATPGLSESSTRPTWSRSIAAVGLIVALGFGVLAGLRLTGGVVDAPTFHRLTFSRGTIGGARLAPDGQTVVFSAAWGDAPMQVFSTQTQGTEARRLDLTQTDLLDVAPTGDLAVGLGRSGVGGWQSQGTLATVSLAGGRPREMAEDILEADFSPDGTELAILRSERQDPFIMGQEMQLEFPSGNVLVDEQDGWLSHARVSRDGNRVAFIRHPSGEDAGSIVVADREGNLSVLSEGWVTAQGLAWSPDGDEVWFTASRSGATRALHAVSLSGRERLLLRIPALLTMYDVAPDGRALVTVDTLRAGMAGRGPDDPVERDLSWLDYATPRALSDDGRTLLFTESGDGGGPGYGVFLRGTDGSPAVRLGDGFAIGLSPDGHWAASARRNSFGELTLLPTGAGEPRVLDLSPLSQLGDVTWLPDGRLLASGIEEGQGPRAYLFGAEGGPPSPLTTASLEGVTGGFPLPDGETILLTFQTGPPLILSIGGSEARAAPGLREGDLPIRWSADGRFLFVRTRAELATVERVDIVTGQRELWKQIQRADTAGISEGFGILLSADGMSYVYSYLRRLSELYLVEGLR